MTAPAKEAARRIDGRRASAPEAVERDAAAEHNARDEHVHRQHREAPALASS
jgi:hypothetical protein